MASADELARRIFEGPGGPEVGAFFDYDGTVISGFSALAFYRDRVLRLNIGPREAARTLLAAARGIDSPEDFAEFLEIALGAWRGRTVEEIEALGQRLFKEQIAGRLHLEVLPLLAAHRQMGHTIALASSATRFQVEPMARELEVDAVLCTPVEVADGTFTGRIGGPTLWGEGKAEAVRGLARERGIDLQRSYAYSNGDEDLPFLRTVGLPCAVAPERGLRAEAERLDWPVLECESRGGQPGVVEVARTAAFYGGMAAAAGAGLTAGVLNRSRSTMVDVTGSLGSELGLALAGVDVKIVLGEEHLWSARPCVFAFNHQSKIDTIILARLLRGGFTGIAKKEVANVPVFGQFFRLAGVAFIDRSDPAKARRAMEPAVEKLRAGTSLVIAPEGTRSPTPRLGPFKKGAFHLAMQAGVPIVPIVIRNAGEVMWRGAQTIRPGTVEVAVLEPVDTSDWEAKKIAEHAAAVREMFLSTLADWPSPRALPAGVRPVPVPVEVRA